MPKTKPGPAKPRPRFRWQFALLVPFLVALFLLASTLYHFAEEVWRWVLSTFGVGLLLLVLGGLVFLALKGWLVVLERWHRWAGGVALVLALFGALSFFPGGAGSLQEFGWGGRLGQTIVGASPPVGVVRVFLLTYLGLLLLLPNPTLSLSYRGLTGLGWGVKGLVSLLGRLALTVGKAGTRLFRPQPRRAAPPPPPPVEAALPPQPVMEPPPAPPTSPLPPPPVAETKPVAEPPPSPPQATIPILTASGWGLPPAELLERATEGAFGPGDVKRRAETLQQALVEYGVEATVVGWNVGPSVTQFEVEPGWDVRYRERREKDKNGVIHFHREEVSRTRVKVDRLTALSNDLALALAAPSIRIEAPVAGKSFVGIEVPNSSLGVVPLRSVRDSSAFHRLKAKTPLPLALGKGMGGEAIVADLAKMPHLLIAGATGSGKTVCLNSLICCLVMDNTPDDLQLVLIDPKRVEFLAFNFLPHLRRKVIVDPEKAVEALRELSKEMDARYQRMAQAGARNIEDFNRIPRPGGALPYLVLVVDELADLMMMAFDEVERNLCRLAQLARATGIHLVVATQRPSVDVVTGLIKANFTARISFALSSQADSRTILDSAGADKLLGRGDMLFLAPDAPKAKRLQGCFVSDGEIQRLVSFWAAQRRTPTAPAPAEEALAEAAPAGEEKPSPADPLLEAARRLAQEHKQLSASFLQRRLQVGYSRAVKLMELLEAEGTIPGKEKEAKSGTL